MTTLLRRTFYVCLWIVILGAIIHILGFIGWIFTSLFPFALAFIGGCLVVVAVVSALETRKRRNGK
ncbi:hypothetical protein ParaMal1_00028 [Paracoccus phage ParMal1]|uniref:Uncharacterized protein n=1 Tax=Paracoccus phage ParMal1 TaxID=3032416 RepID=A0AAF0FFB8_9CAUD|nr:hypothetical protein ParaMal1_00028 [Paracoccus phage ParMal1]